MNWKVVIPWLFFSMAGGYVVGAFSIRISVLVWALSVTGFIVFQQLLYWCLVKRWVIRKGD